MREWLIAIGVLVFIGILLDCVRRMRVANRDSLQMSLSMHKGIDREALDEYGPELPSGGARVAKRGAGTKADAPAADDGVGDSEKVTAQREAVTPQVPAEQPPIQKSEPKLDLEQSVPMLMDADLEQEHTERREPTFNDNLLMDGESGVLSKPRVVERKSRAEEGEPEEQEVIIINVMSRHPDGFEGAALLETILSCGMRYGDMNIFHHYDEQEESDILYSMANIVKPGTFDLNNMNSFRSPGVSLFMTLPLDNPQTSGMEVFDTMLATANSLVNNLDGELKDENRSVMTGQTIEHCRQRISDFARKKLSRTGSFSAD